MNLDIQGPKPECSKSCSVLDGHPGRKLVCKASGTRFTLSGSSISTAGSTGDMVKPTAGDTVKAARIPTRLGRFEMRARLGAGAFGLVFRAHDPSRDREMALTEMEAGRTHFSTPPTSKKR